jgi:hypothetical protein
MQHRVLHLVGLLIASWCVMAIVHESGHIVCGWSCGGRLQSADLRPWQLPYSLFEPDPHPLVTMWGGPVLGVVVPLALARLIRQDWIWFIAYFCLLSNGLYLATAWWTGDRYLDTAKLLEHGAHPLSIATYCLLCIGFGYIGFRREVLSVLGSVDCPAGVARSL